MKLLRHLNPGFGQFRWVVLLLAVAVILPTVCLLWFMNEVVKSERLVVRERLTTFYKNRLTEVADKVNEQWAASCRQLESRLSIPPYRQFVSAVAQSGYEGLLIYDEAGQRLYPVISTDAGTLARPSEDFRDLWEMEFVNQQYEQAAEKYEERARISDDHGRLAAYIGKCRSLAKLGRLDQAIAECKLRAAFSPLAETGDSRCLALIANARLLLLSWTQDKPGYTSLYEETFRKLLAMLYSPNGAGFALPADENLFIAHKVLETRRKGRPTRPQRRPPAWHQPAAADPGRGAVHPLRGAVPNGRDLFDDWPADRLQPAPRGRSCSLWRQPPNWPGDLHCLGLPLPDHGVAGRVRRELPGCEHRSSHPAMMPEASWPGSGRPAVSLVPPGPPRRPSPAGRSRYSSKTAMSSNGPPTSRLPSTRGPACSSSC